VDRAVASTVDEVGRLMESFRFNVCIARLMELTSALRRGRGEGASAASLRAGVEALVTMLSVFAPYTAEDCWSLLGHDVAAGDSVHRQSWPVADLSLLVADTVTCVLQVNGKVRSRLEVAAGIGAEELQALALADPALVRFLADRPVRQVIVRPPRLVNVVV
jgi:leucyl-tRNA synthetase